MAMFRRRLRNSKSESSELESKHLLAPKISPPRDRSPNEKRCSPGRDLSPRGLKKSRQSNWVYKALMKTYEGEYQLAAYDYERIPGNREKMLRNYKRTFFSLKKVAKLIMHYEFRGNETRFVAAMKMEEWAREAVKLFTDFTVHQFYKRPSVHYPGEGVLFEVYNKVRQKDAAIEKLHTFINDGLSP